MVIDYPAAMRVSGVIALVVAMMLAVLTFEAPSAGASGRLPFQVLLNVDGSGHIFMNDGSSPSWQVCRVGLTDCTQFATGNFETDDAPPGSVFWGGGDLVTPLWKGNLRELTPPSVRGRVRGNEVVTPVPGTWEGGWEDDYDSLSLSICTTASGHHCLQVNHEGPERSCGPEGATLIDPAFAGRYLRVVDRRYGSGTVFAGVGHSSYYPISKVEPGATVSVETVSRIAQATGSPSVDCGAPPLSTASISSAGSAEVTCRVTGCRAVLVARRDGRQASVKRKLPPTPILGGKPAKLRLGPRALERLGSGPAKVTVEANGGMIARRTVKLTGAPADLRHRHDSVQIPSS